MTDLWRQQRACENAPGAAREHRAIPQVPPKTGTRGAATGVPGSCLRERKGGFASLLVFRSLQQEPGTRPKLLPYEIPRVRNT